MVIPSKTKLLLADDDAQIRDFLHKLLVRAGYDVIQAEDGKDALAKVRDLDPDLVLLDVMMPRLDGLEVCRILKSRKDAVFLPVILLTAKGDMESRVEGLKLGADDYINKPADPQELLDRIEVLLRIKALQDKLSTSFERDLEEKNKDRLTGLYNSSYLDSRIRDEFQRAARYSEPISCIYINLDGYHSVLLEKGRDTADKVVKQAAQIIQDSTREFDVLIRTIENQFVIVLPRTHITGSLAVATRVWQKARQDLKPVQEIQLGLSMGVSFYPNKDVNSEDKLLDQARQALEKAMGSGQNQICFFQHMAYLYQPDMS